MHIRLSLLSLGLATGMAVAGDLPVVAPAPCVVAVAEAGGPSPATVAVGRWNGWILLVTASGALEFRGQALGEIVHPTVPIATTVYLKRHPVERAAFSDDGRHLVVFFAPDRLRCYDIPSGLLRWEASVPEQVTALAYDHHPDRVVVATVGARVYVYDGGSGDRSDPILLPTQVESLRPLGRGAFETRFQWPGVATIGHLTLP